MMQEAKTHVLIEGCQEACRRCLQLVDSLTDDQYRQPVGGRSSIGAHMRHCAVHFTCFIAGFEARSVNYDARARDLELEVNRDAMRRCLLDIKSSIQIYESLRPDESMEVLITGKAECQPMRVDTTLGRELAFLSSHTIHHLALMTVLADLVGGRIGEDIGLAYSTAAHRSEQQVN